MTYNTAIVREQDGSALRFDSGASLTFHDGAALTIGGRRVYTGTDVPVLAANAGDIYLRGSSAAGSAANIYINRSDGANGGSVWRAASLLGA